MSRLKDISTWDKRRVSEQRKRDRGECIRCPRPAAKGRTRCERCLKIDWEYRKASRAKRKRLGLCTECGKPLTEMDKGNMTHERSACIPGRRIV
jgi:hypothetical protein